MRHVYSTLPNVKVEALHFSAKDITGERLLAMMKVDDSGRKCPIFVFVVPDLTGSHSEMPLYMELIMSILRDMDEFDYGSFREALTQHELSNQQKAMLNLRLALLDSCLKGGDETNSVSTHFSQGMLTIVESVVILSGLITLPDMRSQSVVAFYGRFIRLWFLRHHSWPILGGGR